MTPGTYPNAIAACPIWQIGMLWSRTSGLWRVGPVYSTQFYYAQLHGATRSKQSTVLTLYSQTLASYVGGYGSLLETMAVDRSLRFSWLVAACALASAALVQGKPIDIASSPTA